MRNPCSGRRFLYAGIACCSALALWSVVRRIGKSARAKSLPESIVQSPALQQPGAIERGSETGLAPANRETVRPLHQAAAVLSLSVLSDSMIEHYRGCFFNPAMFVAPAVSTLALAESTSAALRSPSEDGRARDGLYATAMLTGIIGTGYHVYNLMKREGSLSWNNLFHGAPLGAPGAMALAGLYGLAAKSVLRSNTNLPGTRAGRVLGGLTVFGMLGTIAEAWVLHFRGAFQDPFQYVPVTLPLAAAAALAVAAVRPAKKNIRIASAALKLTGLIGLAGIGFHSYGVHRNVGGWRNWSQMILQGPPLPAPLGFTGVALAGLSSLSLLEGGEREP